LTSARRKVAQALVGQKALAISGVLQKEEEWAWVHKGYKFYLGNSGVFFQNQKQKGTYNLL
jgi:hypothetical protein